MIVSPTQLAEREIATFFANIMRPTCACVVRIRELRAEGGELRCLRCSAALVPVRPRLRRGCA